MSIVSHTMDSPPPLSEKAGDWSDDARDAANPVVESAEWALKVRQLRLASSRARAD